MLSLTCKTAIKAVIFLASKFDTGEKSGISETAKFINASQHTIGKILQELVKAKVVNSIKGPNGGFYITAKQKEQSIIKIVEAIDGKDVFRKCGLGLNRCSDSRPCPVHDEYRKIKEQFEKLCQNNKVSDLYKPVNKGLAYLIG